MVATGSFLGKGIENILYRDIPYQDAECAVAYCGECNIGWPVLQSSDAGFAQSYTADDYCWRRVSASINSSNLAFISFDC